MQYHFINNSYFQIKKEKTPWKRIPAYRFDAHGAGLWPQVLLCPGILLRRILILSHLMIYHHNTKIQDAILDLKEQERRPRQTIQPPI